MSLFINIFKLIFGAGVWCIFNLTHAYSNAHRHLKNITFRCSWASFTVLLSFFLRHGWPSLRKLRSNFRLKSTNVPPSKSMWKFLGTSIQHIKWTLKWGDCWDINPSGWGSGKPENRDIYHSHKIDTLGIQHNQIYQNNGEFPQWAWNVSGNYRSIKF